MTDVKYPPMAKSVSSDLYLEIFRTYPQSISQPHLFFNGYYYFLDTEEFADFMSEHPFSIVLDFRSIDDCYRIFVIDESEE